MCWEAGMRIIMGYYTMLLLHVICKKMYALLQTNNGLLCYYKNWLWVFIFPIIVSSEFFHHKYFLEPHQMLICQSCLSSVVIIKLFSPHASIEASWSFYYMAVCLVQLFHSMYVYIDVSIHVYFVHVVSGLLKLSLPSPPPPGISPNTLFVVFAEDNKHLFILSL